MRPPQRSYRIIAPVLVGFQALVLVSCESSSLLDPLSADGLTANAQRGRRGTTVEISAPDSSLAPGQQVQAKAVVKDAHGNTIRNATVSWATSSHGVVDVSTAGILTGGTTMGTTTITASSDDAYSTMSVSSVSAATAGDTTSTAGDTTKTAASDTTAATPDSSTTSSGPAVHMTSITANATTLKVGEVTQVSGVVRDINGTPIPNVAVTWSTSPTTVATVASTGLTTGLVTAKGAGTATLYAKADTTVRSIVITVVDSGTTSPSSSPAPTGGATGTSYGSATPAALPRASVNTAYPSPIRQVRVPAGADLQAAIEAAQPGDELLLAPGASYIGNFYLRDKGSSTAWITIRTDLSDGAIGAPGTRMTPSRAASANLAKILTPNIYSTLTTDLTAHHYRFTGVEIGTTSGVAMNAIVRLGDASSQNSLSTTANNLILDRTYIHGQTDGSVRRCILLNSASTAVVDSWVSACHSNDGDSQAIIGWNGPGPFLIQNNYLEGGHEVVMFGGSTTLIPNVSPSDITLRGNHITRPTSWKGVWQVKNLIELKHARRMLIEGNVIENTWQDGQVGYAFVMKSENQNWDTPWTETSDITIRYNRIRNVGSGFNIAANPSGAPAVPASRFVITDNVMENVGTSTYTGDGRLFQFLGSVADVVAMHNTMVGAYDGNSATMYFGALPSLPRFVAHSNVFAHGNSGIKGDLYAEGAATLNVYATGALVTNNAIADGGTASMYPANNYFPTTLSSIGFVDVNSGNYRLSASSQYLGKGYDGRDIGPDMNQLDALTRNAVVSP